MPFTRLPNCYVKNDFCKVHDALFQEALQHSVLIHLLDLIKKSCTDKEEVSAFPYTFDLIILRYLVRSFNSRPV